MVCPSTLLVKKLNIRENSDFWKGYVVKSLIKLKIQSGGGYPLSNTIFWYSLLTLVKDSFITQDRNDDFEGGQVESTFSWGHCDLTSGTILNK